MKTKEYNEVYQNLTLITAIAAGEYWSINDITDLRDLKKANVSNLEIAQLLGRSYYAVCTKISLIGLEGDVAVTVGTRAKTPNYYGEVCTDCFIFHSPNQVDCA